MKTAGIFFMILTLKIITTEAILPGASPWVDNSQCLPTDPPATCSLKKTACAPINQILSPPTPGGSLVSAITTCANSSGGVIDLGFFLTIGMAYAKGKPESLIEKAAADPAIAKDIRTCVINSTGMLGSDMKINRTAIMMNLASQPLGADVALPIAQAVMTCPEPVDGLLSDFMTCVRKACMDNVSVLPAASPSPSAKPPSSGMASFFQSPAASVGSYGPLIAPTAGAGAPPPSPAGSAQTMSPEVAKLIQSFMVPS